MNSVFAIMLGGFFGAILRYAISQTFKKTKSFPIGTIIANGMASFLLGIFITIEYEVIYSLIVIGFCGGLSTFSTFINELLHIETLKRKVFYVTWNVISSILAVLIGLNFGNSFL